MPRNRPPGTSRATAFAIGTLVVSGLGLMTPFVSDAGAETASATANADAYIDGSYRNRTTGSSTKLVASDASKTTYLRFAVPSLPSGAALTSAEVTLQLERMGGTLRLHATGSSWSESTISASNAPTVGPQVASGTVSGLTATFDVTSALTPGTTVSFAVTNPEGTAAFRSREVSSAAPRVTLEWGTSTTTTRAPTTTTTVGSTPTTRPSSTTTTLPASRGKAKIGMSAPNDVWSQRLAETGPVYARRLFSQLASPDGALKLARTEIAVGRLPVLSFKVPNNDWVGMASGKYDAQLRDLTAKLDALPGQVFATVHHEPNSDGTPANYAAMQRHVLPILGAPSNVDAGPMVNGFWWDGRMSDAQIAQWLPADVLRMSEVVAADTYQAGSQSSPGEDGGAKVKRFGEWATRVGVDRLGIGEYNGYTAQAVANTGAAILADPRIEFGCIWNSTGGIGVTLAGDRLAAFRATLAASVR